MVTCRYKRVNFNPSMPETPSGQATTSKISLKSKATFHFILSFQDKVQVLK